MKKLRNLLIAAVLICAVTVLLPVRANEGPEHILLEGMGDLYYEMELFGDYFADGQLPESYFRYALHDQAVNGALKSYFTFTYTDGYWESAVGDVPAEVLEEVAGRHFTRRDAVADYLRNLQPDWEFTGWSYADGVYHIEIRPAGYVREILSSFAYLGYEVLEDGSYAVYGNRIKRYTPEAGDVPGEDYVLASFEELYPTHCSKVAYGKIQDQAVKAVMRVENGTYAFTSLEKIDAGTVPAVLQGTPAQPEIWAKTEGSYASVEVNGETVGLRLYLSESMEDHSAVIALRGSILAAYEFSASRNGEGVEYFNTPVELRFAVPEGCTEPAVYRMDEENGQPHPVLGTLEGNEYVCQVYTTGTYVLCQDTNGQTALEELLLEAEDDMNFTAEVWGDYFADGQLPDEYFHNQFYAACLHGELTPWFTFTYYDPQEVTLWYNVRSGVADIPAEVVEKAVGRHFTHQELVVERLRSFTVDGYNFKNVTYADGMYHIEVGGVGGMGDPSPIFYYLGYEILADGSYAVYGWRAEYLDETTWESYVPGPGDVLGVDYVYAPTCSFNDKDTVYNVTVGKILEESVRMVVTLKDNTYAYTSYELISRYDIPAELLGKKTEATVGTVTQTGSVISTDPDVVSRVSQFEMWQITDTTQIELVLQSHGQLLAAFDVKAWDKNYEIIPNFQGKLELRLPIPEGCENPGVFCVSEDGTVEEIPGEVVGDQFVCTLSHLSTYVLCDRFCDHQGVLQDQKAATCTEAGYTGDTVCADCGKVLSQGTVIPATGHTGGDVCQDCGILLGKPGDTNGDGTVTVQDAILVLRCVAKLIDESAIHAPLANVSGDGAVTVQDAILILRYVAKLIDTFPVEK